MKKADINSGELIVRIQDKISSMGKNSSWAQLMEAILSEIVILQEEYASQPKDKDQPSETTTLTQNNQEITISGIKYVPELSLSASRVRASELWERYKQVVWYHPQKERMEVITHSDFIKAVNSLSALPSKTDERRECEHKWYYSRMLKNSRCCSNCFVVEKY